jgi:hypothetical protein
MKLKTNKKKNLIFEQQNHSSSRQHFTCDAVKKREREKTYSLLHLKMLRERIQDKLQSIQKLQNRF